MKLKLTLTLLALFAAFARGDVLNATRAIAAPGGRYNPGDKITVTVTINKEQGNLERITGLYVSETLPAGWRVERILSTGHEPKLAPNVVLNPTNKLELIWVNIPPFPCEVRYETTAPAGASSNAVFAGEIKWTVLDNTQPSATTGGQKILASGAFHSADLDRDNIINRAELERLISFYEAGEYSVDATTADGYKAGTGSHEGFAHDSDLNKDWSIAMRGELFRAVQLYNSESYYYNTATKQFEPTVFYAVTGITGVPTEMDAGADLTLTGIVAPANASHKTIEWFVFDDPDNTGATLANNNVLTTTTTAGTVVVRATIANGLSFQNGIHYTQYFNVAVKFTPVTNITLVADAMTIGSTLPLAGTVAPSDATNTNIAWSLVNAGTTGAGFTGGVITSPTATGTVTVRATIADGVSIGVDYTQIIAVTVYDSTIPVTNITGVPTEMFIGENLTLSGTVVPGTATNKDIAWSVANANGTGASIAADVLTATAAGVATVRATITDGVGIGTDYTQDFSIAVKVVPVTNITLAATTLTVGEDLPLDATVLPSGATNTNIVWSLVNAGGTGATLEDNVLKSPTVDGSVVVLATITNGVSIGVNYTTNFTLTVGVVPVAEITDVPDEMDAGVDLPLSGTVAPANATYTNIMWSIEDDDGTGATLAGGNVVTGTITAGVVTVRAIIANGTATGVSYTNDFTIAVNFTPVTGITLVAASTAVGVDLALEGFAAPSDATNTNIVWSLVDPGETGAVVEDGVLASTTAAGTVIVRATITNGVNIGTAYTNDFSVTVFYEYKKFMVVDISGGPSATKYPIKFLDEIPEDAWTDAHKTTNLVMRRIEAGTFTMGSPATEVGHTANNDETQHSVTLANDYYIGVYPVTQKQWQLVMGSNPSYFTVNGETRPVEQVSFDDVHGGDWPDSNGVATGSFMEKIRVKALLSNFDLPTEAQWEFACRAGTTSRFNFGDANHGDYMRYELNSGAVSSPNTSANTNQATAAVGSYPANDWDLYDMHGNVLEWCRDWYGGDFDGSPQTEPEGEPTGTLRVLRGGSWDGWEHECRSAHREKTSPGTSHATIGFRPIWPVPAP